MHILVALLVVAIWGFHTAIVKIGVNELPPFHLLALRFALTGLVFLPFAKLQKKDVLNLLKMSLLFNVCHLSFIFLGLQFLTASSGGSIQQLQVPFAIILSVLFLKERIKPLQILGIIISIIGVVVIKGIPEINLLGFIFIITGAFFFALTQLTMKTSGKIDIPTFTSYTSLFCLPFLIALACLFDRKVDWATVDYTKTGIVLSYQVLLLGVATSVWQRLTEKYGVNKIAPISLLNPVFAILGGMTLLGETLDMHIIIGAGLTISGVAMTVLFKPGSEPAETKTSPAHKLAHQQP